MFVYIKFVIVGLPFLPVAVTLNSSRKTIKMTQGAFLNLISVVMGKSFFYLFKGYYVQSVYNMKFFILRNCCSGQPQSLAQCQFYYPRHCGETLVGFEIKTRGGGITGFRARSLGRACTYTCACTHQAHTSLTHTRARSHPLPAFLSGLTHFQ